MNDPVHIIAFGQTDIGLVRTNNEDSFLLADLTGDVFTTAPSALSQAVGEKGSLFIVADGMGGAKAGEVASRMAVEMVSKELSEQLKKLKSLNRQVFVTALRESIEHGNLAIYQESHRNEERRGMGTTLTAAGVYDGAIFFAQVGDSRGYLVRNSSIIQMTEDQSLVAHLVASGALSPEAAKSHPKRNVILQALGAQSNVDVALSYDELRWGDCLVLCSDGLSGKLEDKELKDVLEKCPEPREACRQMIAIARARGGEDNITAIVAKFDGEGLSLPSLQEAPMPRQVNLNG